MNQPQVGILPSLHELRVQPSGVSLYCLLFYGPLNRSAALPVGRRPLAPEVSIHTVIIFCQETKRLHYETYETGQIAGVQTKALGE